MGECSAQIISFNQFGERVCASSAKISTTSGNSLDIFKNSSDVTKNRKLIRKVLGSGHESIIEHIVFTIAFTNVSVYVEQYLIECRLASFTVKSRRYVDFSSMGYFVPRNLNAHSHQLYRSYMDTSFKAYGDLIDLNIPKEDARFILPYSFFSNFYCTLNARELVHVLKSIKYGRGKGIAELEDIASQLTRQLEELLPWLPTLLENDVSGTTDRKKPSDNNGVFFSEYASTHTLLPESKCGITSLVQKPDNPSEILRMAVEFGMCHDAERQRPLEQLSYTFIIRDISLSGITHMTRHRMQSLIIPPIQCAKYYSMIFPNSIARNIAASSIYKNALESLRLIGKVVTKNDCIMRNKQYFMLSGNTMDIMTTINARELSHFIRLRSCKRAQWEIQNIAVQMLRKARATSGEIFGSVGPSCYMYDKCPEGRMTCGNMAEVIEAFRTMEYSQ